MRLRQLFDDDDAVSPVIGVILMVAITVILAAVIGAFVLGFGGSTSSAPQAAWDVGENGSDNTDFTHEQGDPIDPSNLYCGSDSNPISTSSSSNFVWNSSGPGQDITASDQITCSADSLVWDDGDSSSTLAELDS